MADLRPFRGLRYARSLEDGLAALTAPPYDAIDEDHHRALLARSDHNVVRLELGSAPGTAHDEERYVRAGRTYRGWLDDGVLVPDEQPTFTVYAQEFTVAGRRRRQIGILGALRLRPWSEGTVLPHERVFRRPVEDRRHVLESVGANISPVFLLYRDQEPAVAEALLDVAAEPPDQQFECEDGVRHAVWRLVDRDTQEQIQAAMASRTLLMADGHHRYTAALEHREAHPDRPGAAAVLAYVVAENTGPAILPMHRRVTRLVDDWQDRLVSVGLEPRPLSPDAGSTTMEQVPGFERRLGDDNTIIGIVITRAGVWVLPRPDDSPLLHDLPEPLRPVDTALIETALVGPLDVPATIEELYYTPHADKAAAAVADGRADALVMVRAPTVDDVHRVADAGLRMPPKSTAFFPKPRTGLVLRPLG